VADFGTFVLKQLPPPPQRVLEVGCGRDGGLVELLAGAGYDVTGVDPHAPEGERFLRTTFQEASNRLLLEGFDAVVAGRVLHHVNPLDEGLDMLASIAPLLIVDEFASDRIDRRGSRLVRGATPDAARDRHRTERPSRSRRLA